MQLKEYTFFDNLENEAQEFLKQHTSEVSIPKGNLLFYQGDICEHILWLSEGEVRLFRQEESIADITIYILKPGEQCIVNTVSLLLQTEAVASAETITDVKGYLIDAKSIKELSRISHIYNNYLFSLYQTRFQILTELVGSVKFKHLDTRILEWLQKQPTSIVHITHEKLASELGSTRVSISRILKKLEKKEVLILHKGSIEIL